MTPKQKALGRQQKALRRHVDEILHYMWDPIGIAGTPAARDEYDAYALGVLSVLMRGGTEREVARFLLDVERDRMGLVPVERNAERVAAFILEYRDWVEENVG